MHTMALTQKMAELNIAVHLSARALEITDGGVRCETPDGALFLGADSVVYAAGQRPLREEGFALHDCAPEFHQIGDCVTPRNILAANQAAYTAAKDLGRV
jgi:hypothetical protein